MHANNHRFSVLCIKLSSWELWLHLDADTYGFKISQPPWGFSRLLQNHSPIYCTDTPVLGQKRWVITYTFQPRVIDNIHRDKLRAERKNIQISTKWFVFTDNFCQRFSLFPPCLHFKYWYIVSCSCECWNSRTCKTCNICAFFKICNPTYC